MKLFHENSLDVQEDLRVDSLLHLKTGPEEPNEDEDLAYDDDDLGENTEVTPLGDDMDDDLKALRTPGPLDDDDDDLEVDDAEADPDTYIDDDDEIVDITTSQQNDPEDDDLLPDDEDDDDDLLMDDDEIENPDAIPDSPLSDDDDDEGTWSDSEGDDDLLDDSDSLDDDDDDDGLDDTRLSATEAPQMLDTPDSGVSSRREVRGTGRMVGHEPGTPTTGSEI